MLSPHHREQNKRTIDLLVSEKPDNVRFKLALGVWVRFRDKETPRIHHYASFVFLV